MRLVAEGKVLLPRTVGCCSLVLLLAGAAAAWAGTSNAPNPVVTFDSPGTKQVVLEVCNAGGCNPVTRSVTVLDPMPVLTGFSVSPDSLIQTAVVHLSASGIGQPPLAFHWRIVETISGAQVAALNGATADWTVNVPPGLYTVSAWASNAHGQSNPPFTAVIIVLLPPDWIFTDGFELGNRWVISP